MKTTLLTFCFSLFLIVGVKAQYNYEAIPIMDYFRLEQMTEESLYKTLNEKDIKGSPFLEDEFRAGTIYTTSKQMVVDIPMRYNIYNDDLEFKTPENKIMAVAHPETIELADFGEYKMAYREYKNSGNVQSSFFQVIEEGNATLLLKLDVFYQREEQGDGIKPNKPAQFVRKSDVAYISVDGYPAEKVSSKKDLEVILAPHSKEVEKFIKTNKIKASKNSDLQELVKYYNTL